MLKRLIRGIRVLLLRNDIAHLESAIDEERERHAQFDARMRSWWRANAAEREETAHSDPQVYGLDFDQVRRRFAEYTARSGRWTARTAKSEKGGDK